jgi:toxin ParE1/3/4
MAQIVWTDPALQDINEIAEYIALNNIAAARKLIPKIFSTVERLEQHPNLGRRIPELKRSSYREVIVGPCRIFYKAASEKVYILYVMRAERLLRQYLLEERSLENN